MKGKRLQAFGRALHEIRLERNWSQEEAALRCDVDRAYFGYLERGAKAPTLTMLWRIADGFDTLPSELLRRSERLLDG